MRSTYLLMLAPLLAACSSSSSGNPNPGTTTDAGADDASTDSAPPPPPPGYVTDQGVVVDYGSGKPIANLTVKRGTASSTTDAMGAYKLTVPKDTVETTFVEGGTDYLKLFLPEDSLSADTDRHTVPVASKTTFAVGQLALDGYDGTKAVVYILPYTRGSCTSIAGGAVTVSSPAGTSITYFHAMLPSRDLHEFEAGETPAAALYNVDPGSDVSITVTHPTCKMATFPVTQGTQTFTGKVKTESGDSKANSSLYLWLE